MKPPFERLIENIAYYVSAIYVVSSYMRYFYPFLSSIVSLSLIVILCLSLTHFLFSKEKKCNCVLWGYAYFSIVAFFVGVIPHCFSSYFNLTLVAWKSILINLPIIYVFSLFLVNTKYRISFCSIIAFVGALFVIMVFARGAYTIGQGSRLGNDLLGNANALNTMLYFACFATFYAILKMTGISALCHVVCYSITSFGVMLTGSKKGFFIVFMLPCAYYLFHSKGYKRVLNLAISLIVAVTSLPLLFQNEVFYQTVGRRLEIFWETLSGRTVGDGSTEERRNMIADAIDIWLDNLFFGSGLDMFKVISSYGCYSHNNYTELLSTLGIVGCCFFYAIHYKLLRKYWVAKDVVRSERIFFIIMVGFILFIDVASVSYNMPFTIILLTVASSALHNAKKLNQGACL